MSASARRLATLCSPTTPRRPPCGRCLVRSRPAASSLPSRLRCERSRAHTGAFASLIQCPGFPLPLFLACIWPTSVRGTSPLEKSGKTKSSSTPRARACKSLTWSAGWDRIYRTSSTRVQPCVADSILRVAFNPAACSTTTRLPSRQTHAHTTLVSH